MPKTLRIQTVISGESVNLSSVHSLSNNAISRKEIPENEFGASEQNVELKVNIDRGRTTALVIRPTTDVTLKTNSDSLPDDTKVLSGGQALVWHDGIGYGLEELFKEDITSIYFTNNDPEKAGSIEVVLLSDATINE